MRSHQPCVACQQGVSSHTIVAELAKLM